MKINVQFKGKSRWVIYHERYGLDYDSTHIDPEWHPWLHYTTDQKPTSVDPITYKWVDAKPKPNFTGKLLLTQITQIKFNANSKLGTKNLYVPYSTVPPKVSEWKPPAPKE